MATPSVKVGTSGFCVYSALFATRTHSDSVVPQPHRGLAKAAHFGDTFSLMATHLCRASVLAAFYFLILQQKKIQQRSNSSSRGAAPEGASSPRANAWPSGSVDPEQYLAAALHDRACEHLSRGTSCEHSFIMWQAASSLDVR